MTANSNNSQQFASISKLWDTFTILDSSVKLILPDAISTPHYLPKPKGTKAQAKQQEDRLLIRLEKEYQNTIKNASKDITNSLEKKYILSTPKNSMKEREIESRLLDPYRKSEYLKQELLRKIDPSALTPSPTKPIVPKLIIPIEEQSILNRQRRTMAIQRHTIIMQSEIKQLNDKIEKKEERENNAAEVNQNFPPNILIRTSQWIRILFIIHGLIKLNNFVEQSRMIKASDPQKWKCILLVQRCIRRYLMKKHNIPIIGKSVFIQKCVRQLIRSDYKTNGIVATRNHACMMIIWFTKEVSQLKKTLFRKYLIWVKNLQRILRSHRVITNERISLLHKLLDLCWPLLLSHTEIIIAGRGYDLQNMTSVDYSKLKIYQHLIDKYKIANNMSTVHFHSYLRYNIDKLPQIIKVFEVSKLYYHQIHLNHQLQQYQQLRQQYEVTIRNIELLRPFHHIIEKHKNMELHEIINKKRKQYAFYRLTSKKIKLFKIPKIEINDVKSFLVDGTDPIVNYLTNEKNKEDFQIEKEIFDNINKKQNRVRRSVMVAAKQSIELQQQQKDIKDEEKKEIFLLLRSFNEMDLFNAVMMITLKSNEDHYKAATLLLPNSNLKKETIVIANHTSNTVDILASISESIIDDSNHDTDNNTNMNIKNNDSIVNKNSTQHIQQANKNKLGSPSASSRRMSNYQQVGTPSSSRRMSNYHHKGRINK